jgi:hypothetical protein
MHAGWVINSSISNDEFQQLQAAAIQSWITPAKKVLIFVWKKPIDTWAVIHSIIAFAWRSLNLVSAEWKS